MMPPEMCAMPDVMTLIDMRPLGYPTRFGVDPKLTGGTAKADLEFHVPMLANLPVDESLPGGAYSVVLLLGDAPQLTLSVAVGTVPHC